MKTHTGKPTARAPLTPHQKIMRASRRGTGLYLSADEVSRLSADDAISTCAFNDEQMAIDPQYTFGTGRAKQTP